MKRFLRRLTARATWVFALAFCAAVGGVFLLWGASTGSAHLRPVGAWLIAPLVATGALLGATVVARFIRYRLPLGAVAGLRVFTKKADKGRLRPQDKAPPASALSAAEGGQQPARREQGEELQVDQSMLEGVTVVFPGVGSPVPDTRVGDPDEKTRLRLMSRPPHWLNHLGVTRLGAINAHKIRFRPIDDSLTPEWLQQLCDALDLDMKFMIHLREFTADDVELLPSYNASPWAFPIKIQQRSYNLALVVGLIAARVNQPLPKWVLFTGALKSTFRPLLELERTGGIEDKIRLAMAYPPEKYDNRLLLECLYQRAHFEKDITRSVLGERTGRTVSGEVRLFFIPDSVYLDRQERKSDLMELPKEFDLKEVEPVDRALLQRFRDVRPDDHRTLEAVVDELRGEADLLVLQVSSALQPLFVMGYHRSWYRLDQHYQQVALRRMRGYRVRLNPAASEHRTRAYVRRFADAQLRRLDGQLPATADIHARLDLILRHCAGLLECSCGYVALAGPGTPEGQFSVWARHGGGLIEGMPAYLPADRGIHARVIEQDGRVTIPEAQNDEAFRDTLEWTRDSAQRSQEHNPHLRVWLATLQKVGSCIAYLIKQGSRVIGVLALHREDARPFNSDMTEVVEELVERIAIEAGAALSVLDYLHELNRPKDGELNATPLVGQRQADCPLKELHGQCEALARLILRHSRGGYRASVCLITQDRRKLEVVAAVTDPARPDAWPKGHKGSLIDRAEKTAGNLALKERRSVLIPDTGQPGEYYKPVDPPARANASIVIYHGPHVLGIASVDWDRPLTPVESESMVRALEQIALGYSDDLRFLLMASERRRLDDWFDSLPEDGEPDYSVFIRCVVRMLGTDKGALFLRDPATGKYRLAARPSPAPEQSPPLEFASGKGFPGWIVKNQAPLRISNVHDTEQMQEIQPEPPQPVAPGVAGDADVESLLGVPLKGDGDVFGVVLAMTPRRDPRPGAAYSIAYGFDDYDQQILQAAANRLAGWLREREKRSRQRLMRKLADQASVVRLHREEFYNWDEPRVPTTYQLGCTIREILEEAIGPCEVILRPLNKRQIGGEAPEEVLDRIAFDQGTANSWPVFRVKGERASGEAWVKGATVRKTNRGEDTQRPLGDYASTPIFGQADAEERQLVGVLTIRKEVGALSEGEVRFLEIVAQRAGRAFPLLHWMDVHRLKESLLWHTLVYERDGRRDAWLGDVGGALAIALEAREECAVWRLAGGQFEGVTIGCHSLPRPGNVPRARVAEALRGNPFVVVSCPEKDDLLHCLCDALPAGYPVEAKGRQQAAFVLGHPARPQALFFLVAEPPHRLNYLLAERASRMLHTIAARARERP